ncbi:MAG: tape measure protein [Bacteroidota bacterium]
MSALSDEEKESIAEFKKLNAEAKKAGDSVEDAGKKGAKSVGGMGETVKSVGGAIVAAFSIAAISAFVGKVIDVTSEFQKFKAVLTNTLGSGSAAEIALQKINDFAASTNFSVTELTDAYVKLANRGFKPTTEELRKLADLANSTGKSFDQLTEALLDAFSGENERLKEFGITAKKTGETTQFTFKGVTTEVKNTDEAVKAYVLSLGDLQGVAGSTDAISKTLGGQISNLGDAFDQLFLTIGKGTGGVLTFFIEKLTQYTTFVKNALTSTEELNNQIANLRADRFIENFKTMGKEAQKGYIQQLYKAIDAEAYLIANNEKKIQEMRLIRGNGARIEQIKEDNKKLELDLATNKKRLDLVVAYYDEKAKLDAADVKPSLGLLEALEAELKRLQEAQKKAFSKEAIQQFEREIENTKAKISDLFRERSKPLEQIDTVGKVEMAELEAVKILDVEKRLAKDLAEVNKDQDKEYQKRLQDNFAYFEQIEREKKQLQEELAREVVAGIFELNRQQNQQEQEQNETKRADELKRVGDNKQAQAFINAKYDKEQAAIKTKQAQTDKAQAIFGIIINTALGVMKASPVVPLMALVAALGAVQVGLVAAKPIPKFFKGTEFVEGPGTSTSDSIMARLSVGERVVPAGINRQLAGIPNADLPKLMSMNYDALTRQVKAQSDNALMEELKGLRKDIKRIPINQINMDKKGFTTFIRQGDSVMEVLNNQFSK